MLLNVMMKKSKLLEPLDCHERYITKLVLGKYEVTEGWNASCHWQHMLRPRPSPGVQL